MKRTSIILGSVLALGACITAGYHIVSAGTFPTPGPTVGFVDGWSVANAGDAIGQTAFITGWAYNPYSHRDSVFVALSLTDTIKTQEDLIFYDGASTPRSDVAQAFNLEYDHYGFQIPIPRELYDGESHTIYVWSSTIIENCAPRGCEPINANTGQALIGTVEFTGLDGGIHGAFDTIEGSTAYGWAFDADSYSVPGEHAAILFYVCDRIASSLDDVCREKRYIGGGFTDVTRMDVVAAFPGEDIGTQHGFQIELDIPENLRDGFEHSIIAMAVSHTDGRIVQLPGMIKRTFNADGTLSGE